MMMTNGFGAVLGSFTSGWAIDKYFTKSFSSANDLAGFLETETTNPKMLEFIKNQGSLISMTVLSKEIFMKLAYNLVAFAIYALIIAIAFAILFKHKHNPEVVAAAVSHH
jgi:NHS family xanthosine MFS transporter